MGVCDDQDRCICSENEYDFLSDVTDWISEKLDPSTLIARMDTKFTEYKNKFKDWKISANIMGNAMRIKLIVIVLRIGSPQNNTDCVPRKPFVDWIVKQTERLQGTVLTRGVTVKVGIVNVLPRLTKMFHVLLNTTIQKMLRHLMPGERKGLCGRVT